MLNPRPIAINGARVSAAAEELGGSCRIARTVATCVERALEPTRASLHRLVWLVGTFFDDSDQMKSGEIDYATVGSSTLILLASLRRFIERSRHSQD